MNTETKTLPDVPSQIIRLALADLEKIEHDERYTVNMNSWHTPIWDGDDNLESCEVCFAGAVMAGTLGFDPASEESPCELANRDLTYKLYALDDLRSGDVESLLRACCVPDEKIVDVVRQLEDAGLANMWEEGSIADYHEDPAQFKADMRAIADALEERGL